MLYACPSCNGPIDAEAQLERAAAGAWLVCQCLAVLRLERAPSGELGVRLTTREAREGPEAPADIVACLNALKRAQRREARA